MAPSSDLWSFREALASSRNILILSGAGLSAASGTVVFSLVRTTRFIITTGIPTYRSADESLWNNFVSFRQLAA
jgi:NAD-dependent deacetylase sirtuin 5